MNICILYLGKNGAGNIFTYQMTEALLKKNCNITLISSSYIENRNKFFDLKKLFSFFAIREIVTYKNPREFLFRTLNIFKFIKISNYIKKLKPDYIYIPMISIWASILSFYLPKTIKIITTIHDVKLHTGENNFFIDKINTHLIKNSIKIITLTNSFKKQISEIYKISEDNIYWIEHANFNYYRPQFFTNKQTISNKILFFGRINKYKGIDVLLKSMQVLREKNVSITLEIVGNGTFTGEQQQIINKLGECVQIINEWIPDEEIYKYFLDVDLVVIPYIEASQSGVVMLSYTFAKPVVVTNVGGLPSQVTKETGRIISPNNPYELSDVIIELYKEPETLILLGNNCYKKVTTDYSWNTSADKLLNILEFKNNLGEF